MLKMDETAVVLENKYEFEVIDPFDEKLINEASVCLADAFTGIKVGDKLVMEPMAQAVKISKENFLIFVGEYVKNIVGQGLCFIARDKMNGEIVGALATEIFNPDEEVPEFDDELEPMNKIINFLWELDERFIAAIEERTNKKMGKDQFAHAFMIGVTAKGSNRYIAYKLVELLIEESKRKGLKGVFVEATNFKSQSLVTELFDFYVPKDLNLKPIVKRYAEDEVFKSIPEKIATECQILYKPLEPSYKI